LADEENLTLTKAKNPAGNNNPSFNVFHTDMQSVVDKLKNSGFFLTSCIFPQDSRNSLFGSKKF
jgi:hypothetical protein